MNRNYMVVNKDDICRMHWNVDETMWADFLKACRDSLVAGDLDATDKILIDGHEYCEVGGLL